MVLRYSERDIRLCCTLTPWERCDKIIFTENFIAYFGEIFFFVIIYRDKYNAVLGKKIASDFKTWIYHVQPIGVKATIGFSVTLHGVKRLVAIGIKRSTDLLEVFFPLSEIVVIDEIITCIIGRVNVNHLYTTEVGFAKDF